MFRIVFALAALFVAGLSPAFAEVGDDGLHKEAWFSLTFRDIAEDMAAAKADGKRLRSSSSSAAASTARPCMRSC